MKLLKVIVLSMVPGLQSEVGKGSNYNGPKVDGSMAGESDLNKTK